MGAIWVRALRNYLLISIFANLVWEFAHMPLYTIWHEGTTDQIVFAAIHCTGGDALIAASTLFLALLIGGEGWPSDKRAYIRVAGMTIVFGLTYTVFSEWLNIVIRKAWAYSELMPVIPIIDAGLSPFMQWLIVPLAAFWWTSKRLHKA